MKTVVSIIVVSLVACSYALEVSQCEGRKPITNLNELVSVQNCNRPPCKLKKNTNVEVKLKLQPKKDVPSLKNSVSGIIVGVPFPFVGVDGTDACGSIYKADGVTKAGCPLKAGEEYFYKNNIEVLQIYPRIKVIVHWELTTPTDSLLCFQVPARITN